MSIQHVTSPAFKSGGHQWAIRLYPKGSRSSDADRCCSLFLVHLDHHKDVKVSSGLDILPRDGTQGTRALWKRFDHTFTNSEDEWGSARLIQRTRLRGKICDKWFFVAVCTINMMDKTNDDVLEDISKLLKTGEMTDINFEVDGELFSAHRLILGMRSPVFKAELFGSMSERRLEFIEIKDMKPEVFKALLHFVYTYSLPDDANIDLIQHLVVPANRYAIEGLISRCEERLIENISLSTVLGFLICAERYNFNKLKDACLAMVAQQRNFNELAVSEEYIVMMQEFPSLLADLKERLVHS